MSGPIRRRLGPVRRALTEAMEAKPELQRNFDSSEQRQNYIHQLKTYRNQLQSRSTKFEDLQKMLNGFSDDPDVDELLDSDTALGIRSDEIIVEIDSHLSFIQDRTQNDERDQENRRINGNPMAAALGGINRSAIRLPVLELPKFNGDFRQWLPFWDSFRSSVHENPSITEIEKFNYLRAQVTGEAHQSICAFSVTAENYTSAIEVLEKRYGNRQMIIDSHILAITNMAVVTNNSTAHLRQFVDQLTQHLLSLRALGVQVDQQNFVPIIKSKLPSNTRYRLEEMNNDQQWTLGRLQTQLDQIIARRETVEREAPTQLPAKNHTQSNPNSGVNSNSNNNRSENNRFDYRKRMTTGALVSSESNGTQRPQKCAFCGCGHFSDQCQKYTTAEARKTRIRGNCFKCLMPGHKIQDCRRTKVCFYCKKTDHHSSLCGTKFSSGAINDSTIVAAELTTTATVSENTMVALGETVYLPTAQTAVCATTNEKMITARVLFDSGSQRSYVSAALAKNLNLRPKAIDKIFVSTFGSTCPKEISTANVDLRLQLIDGDLMQFSANVVPTITSGIYRSPIEIDKNNPMFQRLKLADTFPSQTETLPIDILIGSDFYWDIIENRKYKISDGLYLISSRCGWIINGRQQSEKNDHVPTSAYFVGNTISSKEGSFEFVAADSPIATTIDIKKFWDLESIGVKDRIDDIGDEEALRIFNDTIQYENGRYQVTWPWKNEMVELPSNYGLALGRLKSMIRKHQRDPTIIEQYQAVLDDQVKQGIIEPVDNDCKIGDIIHYIPHHAVITPAKEHTKLRIVYDGSAKSKRENPSINDCLHRGPVMLEDVCGLLLRFRLNKIAIVSDIEKAFLQVGLQETARDATRFLWLRDPTNLTTDNNIKIFRFARVPFGINASPFLLSATVAYHMQKSESPTAKNILRNIYVDNVITGVKSIGEATNFHGETKKLFSEMSMNIRDFASNSNEFIQLIPAADRAAIQDPKVLGVPWDSSSDTLSITAPESFQFNITSKRTVLKFIASIFDPIGFMSPILLNAKLFLQKLWIQKYDWDTELSPTLQNEWKSIAQQVTALSKINFPRYIDTSDSSNKQYELHVFCDASKNAYAACVYLRIITPTETKSNLIFSKLRLAPIEPISLPRLELLAVQIGSQMLQFVENQLDIKIDRRFIWSDSQCVLHWINSKKPLSVFVKNRVAKIKQQTGVNFRYVPTNENPADLPSRGKSADEMRSSKLWWYGPEWLTNRSDETWPSMAFIQTNETAISDDAHIEEVQLSSALPAAEGAIAEKEPLFNIKIDQFSSFNKLIRVTAYCNRFIQRMRKQRNNNEFLTSNEIQSAKELWIKYIQNCKFGDIFSAIENKKRHPLIDQLGVYADDNDILRCGGRLQNASLSASAINPILLPKGHQFTKMFISNTHEKLFHSGVAHTLAKLRNEFWIPAGRSEVFKIIKSCGQCKKYDGGPYQAPPMPNLPKSRVTPTAAFTTTGLDYLGPLIVKTFNNPEPTKKVWVCIFTCLSTRAVHLEVIDDLTANEFLLCLKRFISRRGKPSVIISDNATQFSMIARIWKSETVTSFFGNESIDWRFITQRAPWMGGFYERLVRLVKQALKKSIGSICLTTNQLQTVIIEIEAIINSRPLVYIGSDFESGRVITPAHFLSINTNTMTPSVRTDQQMDDKNANISSKEKIIQIWQRGQKLIDNYWKLWHDDYLKNLRERSQQRLKQPRILSSAVPKIGDVVHVLGTGPRGTWPLARINDFIRGADGQIRSARVRLSSGKVTTRAIAHLYPMECEIRSETPTDDSDSEKEF